MLEARWVESLCSKALGGSLRTDVVMLLSDFLEDNNRLVPGRFGYSLDSVGYGSGKLILLLLASATIHQDLHNWHVSIVGGKEATVEESFLETAMRLQDLRGLIGCCRRKALKVLNPLADAGKTRNAATTPASFQSVNIIQSHRVDLSNSIQKRVFSRNS